MSKDKAIETHIINIIRTNKISEQSELQVILNKKGLDIPQATLSRKLKRLKIAKIDGLYKEVAPNQINQPTILNMQISDFGIIVLHTLPGNANGLAYFIDQHFVSFSSQETSDSGILGTIAGDDTILVIVKGKKELSLVVETLKKEFSLI